MGVEMVGIAAAISSKTLPWQWNSVLVRALYLKEHFQPFGLELLKWMELASVFRFGGAQKIRGHARLSQLDEVSPGPTLGSRLELWGMNAKIKSIALRCRDLSMRRPAAAY